MQLILPFEKKNTNQIQQLKQKPKMSHNQASNWLSMTETDSLSPENEFW
jgi:hypothetical protein